MTRSLLLALIAFCTPPAPSAAFRIGENTDDPLTMYMQDVCTVPVNLAGLPAMVVPMGLNAEGLPIGIQLIGAPFGEEKLLAAGAAIEGCESFRH